MEKRVKKAFQGLYLLPVCELTVQLYEIAELFAEVYRIVCGD